MTERAVDAGAEPLSGFVTASSFEEVLAAEVHTLGPRGPRWPSLVTVRAVGPPGLDPAFCQQPLANLGRIQASSVAQLAHGAVEHLLPALDGGAGPLFLHAYVPDPKAYASLRGRSELVGQAFREHLLRVARRVGRRIVDPDASTFAEGAELVQLVLVGRGSLLVSAAAARRLPSGWLDLAPWPGGRPEVPADRTAPSRAYRKLLEAWALMGEQPAPGSTCIDLGGSPGGWAHTTLRLGANVVAVDRAPLAQELLRHPRLAMVVGDAFAYRPQAPADWLLCDVICEPERTVDLVGTWMGARLCRRVVATIKFKGRGGYGLLADVSRRLAVPGWRPIRLKHLPAHHNEVVLLAQAQSG